MSILFKIIVNAFNYKSVNVCYISLCAAVASVIFENRKKAEKKLFMRKFGLKQ